jgi:hypothetical protein
MAGPWGMITTVGSAKKHRYAPELICHIRSLHPQDDHYGLAPLQAAATAIDVHNSAARWSKALLDNAARPSGAIVYRGIDGQGAMSRTSSSGCRGAGNPSPGRAQCRPSHAAGGRARLETDGVQPVRHGVPENQGGRRARHRAGLRRAADAAGHPRRRDLCQLRRGQPGLLPADGAAAGAKGSGCAVALALRPGGDPVELSPDLDQVPALAAEREAQWRRIARPIS